MCEKECLLVKGIGGFYYGLTKDGEVIECKAKGLFKKEGISPIVGDSVGIKEGENNHFTLTTIYERKNSFIRPPVANVDTMVVVVSEKEPKVNVEVLDKFLVMAEKNHIKPIICVNKIELLKKASIVDEIYGEIYPVIKLSAKCNEGIETLRKALPKGNIVLAGPSGVGKSTILNKLLEIDSAEVGQISDKTKRGKHTTRHVEIFSLDQKRYVFDTPGFTSFELQDIEKEDLQDYFPEIEREKEECKYKNCNHIAEPNCQVIKQVQLKKISEIRYENYKKLYKLLEKQNEQIRNKEKK